MSASTTEIKCSSNNESVMKIYVCDICNSCYTIERSLKLHRRFHKPKTAYLMKGDIDERSHANKNESVKEDCQESDEADSPDTVDHQQTSEDLFTCRICNTKYIDNTSFKAHAKKIPLKCETCKKKFNSKCSLQAHNCNHIEDRNDKERGNDTADQPEDTADQPEDTADQPEDIADQPEDTADQPQDMTDDDSSFLCSFCKKSFTEKSKLDRHRCNKKEKTIDDGNERSLRKQKSRSCKQENVKSTRNGKRIRCDICKQYFNKLENIKAHYKLHVIRNQICKRSFLKNEIHYSKEKAKSEQSFK